ncbi:hypothetical protein NDU88_007692 [Pleurodeles waltl]|uniref:Secreted protein n=1 Tax=Pleurodeles waltl TaxID=8319 RepID=A0AAV7U275_PLEWA|nr:hypothetical protein NDU88_007692 [Pleurodeles waltl]
MRRACLRTLASASYVRMRENAHGMLARACSCMCTDVFEKREDSSHANMRVSTNFTALELKVPECKGKSA